MILQCLCLSCAMLTRNETILVGVKKTAISDRCMETCPGVRRTPDGPDEKHRDLTPYFVRSITGCLCSFLTRRLPVAVPRNRAHVNLIDVMLSFGLSHTKAHQSTPHHKLRTARHSGNGLPRERIGQASSVCEKAFSAPWSSFPESPRRNPAYDRRCVVHTHHPQRLAPLQCDLVAAHRGLYRVKMLTIEMCQILKACLPT